MIEAQPDHRIGCLDAPQVQQTGWLEGSCSVESVSLEANMLCHHKSFLCVVLCVHVLCITIGMHGAGSGLHYLLLAHA